MKKMERNVLNKMHNCFYRKNNHNYNPTIISQNCIGGVLYKMLGLQFTSPTINMFIEDENFVKLVENLEHYINVDAKPKVERYIDPIDSDIIYPIIQVDDIELCCLHYSSCAEAVNKWNARRKRVDLNNVYVIANTWNLHNRIDLIERLLNTAYKTIIFSLQKYTYENCINLIGDFWYEDERGIVRPNLTDREKHSFKRYFEDQFDFVTWLNL